MSQAIDDREMQIGAVDRIVERIIGDIVSGSSTPAISAPGVRALSGGSRSHCIPAGSAWPGPAAVRTGRR